MSEIIDRIIANPNPHKLFWLSNVLYKLKSLDKDASIDSARNVFAVVGVGAAVAYMGTMPPYLVPVALVLFGFAFYADYRRHF
jgi:hypothetical protein